MQQEIRSFVSVLRSPVTQPFERGKTKRATSRKIDKYLFFLFSIVFSSSKFDSFFPMRRRTVQQEIRSFVSVLRSSVTQPFDRGKRVRILRRMGTVNSLRTSAPQW